MEIETVSESFRSHQKTNEWRVYIRVQTWIGKHVENGSSHPRPSFLVHASPQYWLIRGMAIFSCTSARAPRDERTQPVPRAGECPAETSPHPLHLLTFDRPTDRGRRERRIWTWDCGEEGAVVKLESEIEGVPASPLRRFGMSRPTGL